MFTWLVPGKAVQFLFSWLAQGPLDRILTSVDKSVDNETDRQKIRAKVIMSDIQTHATLRQASMRQPMFWRVWALFAVPLGLWWVAVITVTVFDFGYVVHDLPPSIRPWADRIFDNIFLAGGAVAGSQILASAIVGRRK